MWYERPASVWTEALPLGNGRLGAMVFGCMEQERISLNEDTLWAGYPAQEHNPDAYAYLQEARKLLAEGRYAEAQKLVQERMLGAEGNGVQPYQPLGDLYLRFGGEQSERGYRRELDLETAVTEVAYEGHRRTVFISAVDQVMVVRLESDGPNDVQVEVTLDSQLRHTASITEEGALLLAGRCPKRVRNHNNGLEPAVVYDEEEPGLAMSFAAAVRVSECQGGRISAEGDRIIVSGASAVTLIYAAATSFDGFDKAPGLSDVQPAEVCAAVLDKAIRKTYGELLEAHVRDYRSLFGRVRLELGGPAETALLPTDERLRRIAAGSQDPAMTALVFQFGRYLLVSSSRPGTQAANLQGIWNDRVQPPWNCDYHLNINLQMNYWLAETCNLAECHEPLLALIEEQAQTGAATARIQYGCGGWTAHTMSDIWRTNNVGSRGDAVWAYWPMAGAWLCQHLWERYSFGGDRGFLENRAWPIIKGAARFVLDWLVEDEDGRRITSPSVSPENWFRSGDGTACGVTQASAMDMQLAWELLQIAANVHAELGIDEAFALECEEASAKLKRPQIGSQGQLLEWNREFAEEDPQHRHLSHLFGLFPGRQFTFEDTPDIIRAIERTMELRGDEATGWSMGWKLAVWARLRDGDHALRIVRNFLNVLEPGDTNYRKGGIYANLFCAHPPFQIDGNFGVAAGIAELLLQSHRHCVHLLPALPGEWADGRVSGLRARGGCTVSIVWAGGELAQATLVADRDGVYPVRYGDALLHADCRAGVPVGIRFTNGKLAIA
ncbi:glycosyl hydrolase family 95 catalytic domain-containing protein [Paenibacillus sp. MBLB4367]|uniref:glycoside hydrolase family 95 protein n=1 Tax=Paenibacillus sp. MBLB4367 TaxID=3384767 RepID=UPI003907E801